MTNFIRAKDWPARRPDGQTANAKSDPAPTVKGSGQRPGLVRIEARVPSQIGQKFKWLCALNQLEIKDVINALIVDWNEKMSGRLAGQPALDHDLDDLRSDRLIDEDETLRFLTSSSDQSEGRPDGWTAIQTKGKEILTYYTILTGNQIRQGDRAFLETIIDLPIHVIRGGIAQSMLRCKTRIGSLAYCQGAIEEIRQAGVDKMFAAYLEGVLAREDRWNPALTPLEPQMIEEMRRRRAQQPDLPGTSGDVVQLKPTKTKQEDEYDAQEGRQSQTLRRS